MPKLRIFSSVIAMLLAVVMALTTSAQETGSTVVLSNNTGDASTEWFVEGEPSLVINGFDLTARKITLPATITRVSIAVRTPMPGTPIDVVVYQDANGGSPSDATLAGRAQVDITQAGTFTATFDPPVVITQPVVWVGFYLPVDFKFLADTSGTSVLTYWAWNAGGRFDPANLSAASVLGPANGTAPVNIDMKGIARISAEIRTATSGEVLQAGTTVSQLVGSPNAILTPLQAYEYCSPVLIDTEDVSVTLGQKVRFFCAVMDVSLSPPAPAGYERRAFLYDIFAFGIDTVGTKIPGEVTHCIRPAPEDLDKAVIGLADGAPRRWKILVSQRYGDLVCAELPDVGFLSYFVPGSGGTPPADGTAPTLTPGANLVVDVNGLIVNPHPLVCGQASSIKIVVKNIGTTAANDGGKISIQDILASTGAQMQATEGVFPILQPGESHTAEVFLTVSTNYDALHRIIVNVDSDNRVAETNESDNSAQTDHILAKGSCP